MLQVNDEVQILPDIMILSDVELEAFLSISIKCLPLKVANEAFVLLIFKHVHLLTSKLCKRINNNTEDNVKQNCNDDQEECQIVNGSEVEALDVLGSCRLCWQELTDSSTTSNTVVDGREEAMHHRHTNRVTLSIEQATLNIVIIESIEHEYKANRGVNVDNDGTKHGCHEKLVTVERNRLNNVLQLRESRNDVQQMERVEDRRLEKTLER